MAARRITKADEFSYDKIMYHEIQLTRAQSTMRHAVFLCLAAAVLPLGCKSPTTADAALKDVSVSLPAEVETVLAKPMEWLAGVAQRHSRTVVYFQRCRVGGLDDVTEPCKVDKRLSKSYAVYEDLVLNLGQIYSEDSGLKADFPTLKELEQAFFFFLKPDLTDEARKKHENGEILAPFGPQIFVSNPFETDGPARTVSSLDRSTAKPTNPRMFELLKKALEIAPKSPKTYNVASCSAKFELDEQWNSGALLRTHLNYAGSLSAYSYRPVFGRGDTEIVLEGQPLSELAKEACKQAANNWFEKCKELAAKLSSSYPGRKFPVGTCRIPKSKCECSSGTAKTGELAWTESVFEEQVNL